MALISRPNDPTRYEIIGNRAGYVMGRDAQVRSVEMALKSEA